MSTQAAPALLEGKSVVIVGGTTGLGLSAARAILEAGGRVLAVGRNKDSVAEAQQELGKAAKVLSGDATKAETAERAVSEAVSAFGRLDGIYHVAGGSGRRWGDGPLHEITDEGWRATLDSNLTSLFYSNRAAVRQFLKQKAGGSILNMSSVLAWSPSPLHFSTHTYAAAKSAVIGLTISCAAHYAPLGIRFNVVAPGLVATPMSERAQGNQDVMRFIRSKQPLDSGRIASPEDLDAAVVFFMSDGAKFVTGQVLAVDGGWSVTEGHLIAP